MLDAAVLVVSAVEGVQAQTLVLMRRAAAAGLPRSSSSTRWTGPAPTPTGSSARSPPELSPEAFALGQVTAPPRTAASALNGRAGARLARGLGAGVLGSAITGAGVASCSTATRLPARPARGWPRPARSSRRAAKEVVVLACARGRCSVRDRVDLGARRTARVTGLRRFHRGGLDTVTEATAGHVVVLRGSTPPGSATGSARARRRWPQEFSRPSLATVVEPLDERDRPALYAALDRLAEQDPLIALRVDGQSGDKREMRLSLYGEVQQQVIGSLLEEEYGVAVRFRDTAMICTERLRGTGAAVELIGTDPNPYLATVGLRVEPAPVGSGVEFGLEVELGSMPPAFFTAVEKRAVDAAEGNHGWEVPDARVRMTHSGYYARQSHAHGTFDKAMSSTAEDFRT